MRYRGDLRRVDDYARSSRVVVLPLLAGGLLGLGYTMGAFSGPDPDGRRGEGAATRAGELDDGSAKRRAVEEALANQTDMIASLARQAEEHAREKEALRARMTRVEETLAEEKKERMELEVLVGKAEQRWHDLEKTREESKEPVDTLRGIKTAPSAADDTTASDATLEVPDEEDVEESDVQPDGVAQSPTDATTLYTGRLNGQVVFERAHRSSTPDWSRRHIYVLVRWGESSWIVTEGSAKVNDAGAVEGPFKVILPISTIRTLDVTAIATDKEYRRYQYVQLPDHTWKASIATIEVRRS